LLIFAACGFAFATWASRLVAVRLALGVDPDEMGLLLLCWSAGSVAGMPLAGRLIARFGGRRLITAAAAVAVAALAGAGLAVAAGSAAAVAGLLVALGLGVGVWDVSMNVAAGDVERALARSIMPRFHAGYSLGTVLGAALGAGAARLGVPVAAHLAASALVCLAAVLWGASALLAGGASAAAGRARRASRERSAWREPRVVLLGLAVLSLTLVEGGANDWMASGVVEGFGTSESVGIVCLAVFLAAQTAARVFGTHAVERLTRPAVIRASAVFALVGVAMFALGPSLAWVFAGAAWWGVGAALVFPLGMSAASDDPLRAARRTSVVATIGYGAFLAGPPLLGFLAEHIGFRHAMLVLAAPVALAAALAGAARQEPPTGPN
jgi:MFS family permease